MESFKTLFSILGMWWCTSIGVMAQTETFCGNLYNEEFDVFFNIDLKDKGLMAPGHEIYGLLAGYMGKADNSFYWLVVDAEIKGGKATLQMVNDLGSEDLMATLEQLNDSTYKLTQKKGSSIKIPNNGKWMKLPNVLDFKIRNYRRIPTKSTP